MANALIVHDDSVISRVAHLLEERKRNVRTFEAILVGEDKRYEGVGVDPEDVKQALKTERQLLADMAAALREEGHRVDELKALMLAFFFDLNGVDSGPAINRSTSKRAAESFAASGMNRHEMEELYIDTIRQDTVPRPVMLVKDSLYVFELCLEGKFEEADAILARFMEGPTKR